MKLKALDTLHVSSVSPHSILAGQSFETSDKEGEEMVKRGLAVEDKSDLPPLNKMEPAPLNKAKPRIAVKRKS